MGTDNIPDYSTRKATRETLKRDVLVPALSQADEDQHTTVSYSVPDALAGDPDDCIVPSLFTVDSYSKQTTTWPPVLLIKASYTDTLPVQHPETPPRPVRPRDYQSFDVFCRLEAICTREMMIDVKIMVSPRQPDDAPETE